MGKTTARKAAEVEWLRWLIDRIGSLGKPEPVEYIIVPGDPPRGREVKRKPWPFKDDRPLGKFRDDLGRFARVFAPHIVRHDQFKPSFADTRRVLQRLWGVYLWARTSHAYLATGEVVLGLGKTSAGPSVTVHYDVAFEIVRAFAELSSRYVGRFRRCNGCKRDFLARRKNQSRCKRCTTRDRVRRHRAR
jgi:hypothetical protein